MEAPETGKVRKVGELAAASGLTVRTLHYYEQIGLLVPAERTEAGHRLYSDSDIERLYRIDLLRRLGLSLADIGKALDDPAWNLKAALGAHVRELERRLDQERRLHSRLAHLLATLGSTHGELTDDLLTILEEMTMLDTNAQRRISTLVYADPETAYDFLKRVFGFGPGQLTRDEAGHVVHGELQAGDGVVWLHLESAEFELSSPRSLGAATACVSVLVDDVDGHFERTKRNGALIVYPPRDQPYGYREYSARDCEGHLWSFMKAID
jgi:DNA-binding transcriptional MerR regulator